jgi:hypothetical protein
MSYNTCTCSCNYKSDQYRCQSLKDLDKDEVRKCVCLKDLCKRKYNYNMEVREKSHYKVRKECYKCDQY